MSIVKQKIIKKIRNTFVTERYFGTYVAFSSSIEIKIFL